MQEELDTNAGCQKPVTISWSPPLVNMPIREAEISRLVPILVLISADQSHSVLLGCGHFA